MDFAKLEEGIRVQWKENNTQETVKTSRIESGLKFKFLDGPPFCNGQVHYGHLLVSTIKDTIARFKSQQGYNISYQIGFDCHGLPIESEAEKTVGKISPNDSNEQIKVFNDRCREIISNTSESWFNTLGQLGRQFDRQETYYTHSFDYMQHLWSAFKQLYDNGLVYMSKKVMPYSGPCQTPLSNFEASSNYKDRVDTSVYAVFRVKNTSTRYFSLSGASSDDSSDSSDGNDQYLVIWTTTPWSLVANQGICVNPELEYALVNYSGKNYWISQNAISKVFELSKCSVITITLGKNLAGLEYEPIFDNSSVLYKVYCDSYVLDETGTGLVHLAPLFGEDDYRVMKLQADQIPEHLVDSQLCFTVDHEMNGKNLKGQFVIDTALDITIALKKSGQVLKSEKITHSYPHCWRTDTPLVYLACDAWFINVQRLIPDVLENNSKINWYPKNVGTERFSNWIKTAPDWCISRNRVWGTPIPIWTSPSGRTKCIGSVRELEELTNTKVTDLHLDHIQNLEFDYEGEHYKRTFGVLDCWFESGMAPTARYPFTDNNTSLDTNVDFIAESLDQTRGWFYTLNVLSTALYNKPAYNSVIVSGLILAEDGKKMSKRLKNYTDPLDIMNKYGSDVLRLYLLGSPSTRADPFCFKDADLGDISRKLVMYTNAIAIYKDSLVMYGDVLEQLDISTQTNKLDIWIYNIFHNLRNKIYTHLEALELIHIPGLIYKFIDQLCNTYIKLSRDRLKSQTTPGDAKESLQTLGYILNQTNLLIAPFTPHLADYFHRELGGGHSIHLDYINVDERVIPSETVLNSIYSLGELFEAVRNLRVTLKVPILYPLDNLIIYSGSSGITEFNDVIRKELNIKTITLRSLYYMPKKYTPNKGLLGKLFKARASEYYPRVERGDIADLPSTDCYNVEYVLDHLEGYVSSKFDYYVDGKRQEAIIYLSNSTTEENQVEAEVNHVRRQVNILRKEMGLKMYDKVAVEIRNSIFWNTLDPKLINNLNTQLGGNVKYFDNLREDYYTIKSLSNDYETHLTITKI
jgi:isoleucyl-tRNA synthetase